jgi:hypothetical protein
MDGWMDGWMDGCRQVRSSKQQGHVGEFGRHADSARLSPGSYLKRQTKDMLLLGSCGGMRTVVVMGGDATLTDWAMVDSLGTGHGGEEGTVRRRKITDKISQSWLPGSEPRKRLEAGGCVVVVRLCRSGGDGGMQPCPLPIRKEDNRLGSAQLRTVADNA